MTQGSTKGVPIDTDVTLSTNSDLLVPSQKAIKAYVTNVTSLSSLATVGTITSGAWNGTPVGLAYGGTNADLSGTGGTSQFLRQNSVGGSVTVVRPAFTDLSGAIAFGQFHPLHLFAMSHRVIAVIPNNNATSRTIVGNATGATLSPTPGTSAASTDGIFQSVTTGATSGNQAGGNYLTTGATTGSDVQLRWLPALKIFLKTSSDLSSQRIFAGWTSASVGTADSPSTTHCILLRYSTGASDTNWKLLTSDAATVTVTDLGVAPAISTSYQIVVVATSSTTIDVWFGTTDATMTKVLSGFTTTLPSSSTNLFAVMQITTLTNGTRSVSLGGIYISVHT